MKIQNLAVIFIVIILPISLVISTYTKYQIQTVNMQSSYDSKLLNATYDAVKSYQMNAAASGSSDIANSKLRDIEASANTFYNSISSNFNMVGYNQDVLKEYVPTLVYTMYDGMYLYSTYTNELSTGQKGGIEGIPTDAKYKEGDKLYGLKPYIFYSCRYQKNGSDVVITYSLDNYISIQGIDSQGNPVNIQGYLLSDVQIDESNETATYRGVTISPEDGNIYQNVYDNREGVEDVKSYFCRKIDGVKYYDAGTGAKFSFLNNQFLEQKNGLDVKKNTNAYLYFKEAYDLKEAIKRNIPDSTDKTLPVLNIADLTVGDAVSVDNNGNIIHPFGNDSTPIFEGLDNSAVSGTTIEEPNSNFNQHRLQVIRKTVEDSLTVAMANYNTSMGTYEFRMPKLKEDEWDKILNNIAVISFLQGVNIGGKVYNGYAIVPNNENEDVVTESSIYIIGKDGSYRSIFSKDLKDDFYNTIDTIDTARGVFSADLERHSIVSSFDNKSKYYFPKGNIKEGTDYKVGSWQYADYNSLITSSNTNNEDNIYKYVDGLDINLKKIYYTALARERYGTYKGARFTVKELQGSSNVFPGGGYLPAGASEISNPEDAPAPLAVGATASPPETQEVTVEPNNYIGSNYKPEDHGKVVIETESFCWPQQKLDTEISYDHVFGPNVPGHTASFHDGLDLQCGEGTPILAAANGVVKVAGDQGGYGNYVRIDHSGNGFGLFTFYGHMSKVAVKPGQTVKKGQIIGYEGSTGNSTGSHLHFGCRVVVNDDFDNRSKSKSISII